MEISKIQKNIAKNIIQNNRLQFTLLSLLSFFLTCFSVIISIILYNEMIMINSESSFSFVIIAILIVVVICFVSFYSIAYMAFLQEEKSLISLKKVGVTDKELGKIARYQSNILVIRNVIPGTFAGFLFIGLIFSWKLRNEADFAITVFLMFMIWLCIRISFSIGLKKVSFYEKNKRIFLYRNGY